MRTQNWEIWKRDPQTLTVSSWSVLLGKKLNAITKTYPRGTKFIKGDEVAFIINIADLSQIEHLLGLPADYIISGLK